MPADLRASLRPYRVHNVVVALLMGSGVVVAGIGAAALVSVLWAARSSSAAAPVVVALLLAIGVLGGAGVSLWRVLAMAKVPSRLAFAIERLLPQLGDSVRGAVGLDETLASATSRALAQAHVTATRDSLNHPALRAEHLRRRLRHARGWLVAGALGALAVVVCAIVAPERLALGFRKAMSWQSAAGVDRAAALPPLWSDVTLSIDYPAYMRRVRQVIEGVSGDFTAPRGAEVGLQARADRNVQAARLVFASGDVSLGVTAGRELAGRFTVQHGGKYRLALTDTSGDEVIEPEGHTITLEPDHAPTVELLQPEADGTVLSDEKVQLAWRGRDDFGLTSFDLVIRNLRPGSEPVRKPMAALDGEPAESSGRFALEIASLDVRPGDRLVLSMEARDNDTVAGPKVGISANRTLKVFSAAEHHNELIEKQELLLRQMVAQLADELETPLANGDDVAEAPEAEANRWLAQVKRGQALGTALEKLAADFDDDELAPAEVTRALRNIRSDLMRTYDELAVLAAEMVNQVRQSQRFPEPYAQRSKRLGKTAGGKLEQHILYMEDLIGRQRLTEAQDAARELVATQARLKDLLQKYKDAGDEETRKRILEEMKALKEQLRALSEKLARLQRELPQEYVNTDALNAQDLKNPLDEIDRLLQEGDVEGAARALDKMAQSTRDMLDEMQKSEDEYGGEEYAELREQLDAFQTQLEEVTAAQEGLLQESRSRMHKAREKAMKQLGEDIDDFAQRLQKEAEEVAASLKQMPNRGMLDLENEQRDEAEAHANETARALKAKDFDEALRSVNQLMSNMEWLRASLADRTEGRFATTSKEARKAKDRVEALAPKARKIEEALKKMMPSSGDQMSAGEREQMKEAGRKQGRLAERARQLGQSMDEIGKQLPVFSPEHRAMLDAARREMHGAQADLQSEDMQNASGRQREALGKMKELKDALAQMGQQGGGGGGKGMPLPFGQGGGGGRKSGRLGSGKDERVEIPGAESYKVPQQFRKDILDAMKESPPPRFEGEVKRYYEELVK